MARRRRHDPFHVRGSGTMGSVRRTRVSAHNLVKPPRSDTPGSVRQTRVSAHTFVGPLWFNALPLQYAVHSRIKKRTKRAELYFFKEIELE